MYQIENLYRNPIPKQKEIWKTHYVTNFNSRLVINFMIHNVLTLKIIE